MIPNYPLQWPASRERTKAPKLSQYAMTLATAYAYAVKQLTLLGAKKVVISSNAILRKDGQPSAKQPKIVDAGVVVWFQLTGNNATWYAISCDTYNSIAGNLRTIGLSIIDIRKVTNRLNTPLMRMFMATPPQDQSQQQKPPPRQEPPPKQDYQYESPQLWRDILSVPFNASWPDAKRAYYQLAKQRHPDTGGSVSQFQELSRAYAEAKKYFGVN